MQEEPKTQASERTTLDVAGVSITLVASDIEAIRAALIERLERSPLPEQKQLLVEARYPQVTFDADSIAIGGFGLSSNGGELVLMCRLGAGAAGMHAFQADVTQRAGAWQVGEVDRLFIHPRR